MREYSKKSESQSRTLDSNPKASRQAPIDVILQRYKERNIQRYEEDEELIQAKLETAQREKIDEDELLQGKFESVPTREQKSMQREEKPNNTGLPDNLKTGIENLSGYSMDDVQVHYNSSKPAQLQALAYAQGTDIHVAPGQEQHLPHEAWHVVQQKQGRVQPTVQLHGVNVNDNEGLEKEADVMGIQANTTQMQKNDSLSYGNIANSTLQRQIQISGSPEYIAKVLYQINILLDENWKGIIQGEETLEMEDAYLDRIEEFISIGETPAAKLFRRRIASLDSAEYAEWGMQTIIQETDKASSTDGMSTVSWNSEEKMICYTKNGFEINPPEILLAHEIGHADGFLSGETNSAYKKGDKNGMLPYIYSESLQIDESAEELRNTGISSSKPDSTLDNPFSENEIRDSKGLSKRLIYSKLISWWVKEDTLTLDPPVNKDILKYYKEKIGLLGVKEIVEKEILEDSSLNANKKQGIIEIIINYITTEGAESKIVALSEIPDDTTSLQSEDSTQLKEETISNPTSKPIQFDDWTLKGTEIPREPGGFNKGISVEADAKLCTRIDQLIIRVREAIDGEKSVLLYLAVGTANKSANGTNFSGALELLAIRQQQKPSIIDTAQEKGYTTIVLNIDDFSSSESDEKFDGLFPMSGKTTDEKEAQSIGKLKELFGLVYSTEGKTTEGKTIKGQVILVNAVEDTKPAKSDTDTSLDHSKFRGYLGFTSLFPGRDKKDQFTYATSYLAQYQNFDLYKPTGHSVMGYLYKSGISLSQLSDLTLE
ncbi:MAG: DUF4157 domain-containing protein [Dysgonomonas mossii]|uniref:eCIS core domain-containing protein n=1 Tax=Dysgonomonas mossii DSM 22836 TaxID=742767 RepID=F8X411_9BACT|nr:M91 family zinc metallopeptidase [Dysgonomonas mossii]EGK05300.1 hypothetical protein HMPREF9456_02970 [Dysgonomonas mossii DSM 22836]